jgi:hypothetical protein
MPDEVSPKTKSAAKLLVTGLKPSLQKVQILHKKRSKLRKLRPSDLQRTFNYRGH